MFAAFEGSGIRLMFYKSGFDLLDNNKAEKHSFLVIPEEPI
jgi:hypothetical protein